MNEYVIFVFYFLTNIVTKTIDIHLYIVTSHLVKTTRNVKSHLVTYKLIEE